MYEKNFEGSSGNFRDRSDSVWNKGAVGQISGRRDMIFRFACGKEAAFGSSFYG